MKIHLIAFGKLKTPGLREAMNYYARLIGMWAEFRETELKPVEVREKSEAAALQVKTEEEEIFLSRIEKECSSRAKIILLDERGKSLTSVQWSEQIEELKDRSVPELIFAIGGSLGFSDSLRKRADAVWCLGLQTTSHELARVMLTEQVFRAYSILNRHPYHNG